MVRKVRDVRSGSATSGAAAAVSSRLRGEGDAHGGRTQDWVWHRDQFAQIFGERRPGRFVEQWPTGKRVAVVLTFDTQADVDAAVAKYQTCLWSQGRINYCDLTMRQYDVLEGLPRVLRILRKHDVRATFPTCGMTADWYPDDIKRIQDDGHEIAVHGYHHVELHELTESEERAEIERATEAIARLTGEPPRGWRCPLYSATERTLETLRDLDYQWNSDFHDCDFPYVLTKNSRDIVEVPAGSDDWTMYLQYAPGSPQMGGTPYGTSDGVLSSLKAEFDVLYEESAEEPRMLQWCMHPKISGRPFRAAVLDKFIAYAKQHDGTWFPTCMELASLA
jgi:peptidoglycan-N-acetylglucosamine deacetylase